MEYNGKVQAVRDVAGPNGLSSSYSRLYKEIKIVDGPKGVRLMCFDGRSIALLTEELRFDDESDDPTIQEFTQL